MEYNSNFNTDIGNKTQIKTIRLGKSLYNRPENGTLTDNLQDPELYKQKLHGYIEVSNIDYVSIRTHVRYFVYDIESEQWKFRTGGLLTKKHDKYVILSNGKYSWSVQRNIIINPNSSSEEIFETKFFKILTKQELTEIALEKQQTEIEQLKKENLNLKKQLHYANSDIMQ